MFRDHLALRRADRIAEHIRRNYSPAVVALTSHGIFRGHKGVMECARRLKKAIPSARSRSASRRIDDGVDTFVIRDGRIGTKTVRYTVLRTKR